MSGEFDWQGKAACRGMDTALFFTTAKGGAAAPKEARLACAGCEVKIECLAFAVQQPDVSGYWGGMFVHKKNRPAIKRYLADIGGKGHE